VKELTDIYQMQPEIISAGGSIKSVSVSADILQRLLLRRCFSSSVLMDCNYNCPEKL